MSLRVRVQPRSRAEGLAGVREGALVVRLRAAPVEGQANVALCRFLGRLLGVPPSAVEIARGASGREKVLRIAGLDAPSLLRRLPERL